jgi:hypothetical protein
MSCRGNAQPDGSRYRPVGNGRRQRQQQQARHNAFARRSISVNFICPFPAGRRHFPAFITTETTTKTSLAAWLSPSSYNNVYKRRTLRPSASPHGLHQVSPHIPYHNTNPTRHPLHQPTNLAPSTWTCRPSRPPLVNIPPSPLNLVLASRTKIQN